MRAKGTKEAKVPALALNFCWLGLGYIALAIIGNFRIVLIPEEVVTRVMGQWELSTTV